MPAAAPTVRPLIETEPVDDLLVHWQSPLTAEIPTVSGLLRGEDRDPPVRERTGACLERHVDLSKSAIDCN